MNANRLLKRAATTFIAVLIFGGPAFAQSTPPAPKPKPKPAAQAKPAAPAAQRNANSDYWSLNYTTPTAAPTQYDNNGRTIASTRSADVGSPGRVPLRSGGGTVGFENQTRMMQTVPGATDPYARKESSFVGLSVNMQSSNNALTLPVLPTPWARSEW